MNKNQKIVFMAGLPRSGSTLLMNILAQNPRIDPSGTSGLFEIIQGMRNQYTQSRNVAAQDEGEMDGRFKSACKQAIKGWCSSSKPVAIDKSRAWLQQYEFLTTIGIKPYIIVTIRDLRSVLASMEKLYRKNSLRIDPVEGMTTTEHRVKAWASGAPVGEACNQVQDIITRGLHENVIFVNYENLTSAPNEVMEKIYSYIEESEFVHDFKNVIQVTREDDRLHGIPNLHNIRNTVKALEDDSEDVIGQDLCAGIIQGAPWFYKAFYPELVSIQQLKEAG